MASFNHTPKGRGYDESLIYFEANIEYYTHRGGACQKAAKQKYLDLWENDAPAYKYNDSEQYAELIFAEKIYEIIDSKQQNKDNNDTTEQKPFFLVYTPHIVHTPMQVPKQWYTMC